MATVIIFCIVLAIIVLAIRSIRKDHCVGNCSGCKGCGNTNPLYEQYHKEKTL